MHQPVSNRGPRRAWRRAGASLPLSPLLLLPLLAGCPTPSKTFDEFLGRYPPARIVDMALPPGSTFDVTGSFLLSISTIVAPDKPLVFRATNVLTPNADGTAALDMELQPLSVLDKDPANGKPDRKAVGNNISLKKIPVDKMGNFTADLGMQMVVGEANPISGSPITATLKLIGVLRSKDRMCGGIEGSVTSPIMVPDLKGSVWGAYRVDAALMGEALPAADFTCGDTMNMDMGIAADMSAMPDMTAPPDMSALPDLVSVDQ